VVESIREFGWTNPILVDGDGVVIAGHARLLAAKKLGIDPVPVIVLARLTPVQKRALVIADNKLALNAGWDDEILRSELAALRAEDFDMGVVGCRNGDCVLLMRRKGVSQHDESDQRSGI
jgi:ParB-like chromosome segregation protein Spo0J